MTGLTGKIIKLSPRYALIGSFPKSLNIPKSPGGYFMPDLYSQCWYHRLFYPHSLLMFLFTVFLKKENLHLFTPSSLLNGHKHLNLYALHQLLWWEVHFPSAEANTSIYAQESIPFQTPKNIALAVLTSKIYIIFFSNGSFPAALKYDATDTFPLSCKTCWIDLFDGLNSSSIFIYMHFVSPLMAKFYASAWVGWSL